MINLDLIWDNIFEYIKDKYGLLAKIDSKQKLQIYGINTTKKAEKIKWLFYQEATNVNDNNAGEVLSGILKLGHSSPLLIEELIDKFILSGLTLEQKYLYNIFETVAKVRSYQRANMYAISIGKTDLDNATKDNLIEIDLIVQKISEEVLSILKTLCGTQKEILDEFEICINQVGVEKATHLLTIIIAYAILKVDYTAFKKNKKSTKTKLVELEQELKEYILKEFHGETGSGGVSKEDPTQKTIRNNVSTQTSNTLDSLHHMGTGDSEKLDENIHTLSELLKTIVSIEDIETLKENMRTLKNTVSGYFDFVFKVLMESTDNDEADWHLAIERHRIWLINSINVYREQIRTNDRYAEHKENFLKGICEFHIVAEACKTEMLLIEGTLNHDAEIYRKRIKIEELKQNYKDAYKQFASIEFEIIKELDNLSKTHSSDIGAK